MKRLITQFLSLGTMYQFTVRFLSGLLVTGILLSGFGVLPFVATDIIFTSLVLFVFTYIANAAFSKIVKVKSNKESWFISALILSLIIGPTDPIQQWWPLLIASATAMGSKYFVTFRHRHLFNPAAFGVVVMSITTGVGSSWWVGIMPLTIFVLVGGYLIDYKIRRVPMVLVFLITYALSFVLFNGLQLSASDNAALLESIFLNSPIIFFAVIMLPEPVTSPAGNKLRIPYALGVAIAATGIQRIFPAIGYSLELALLAGNIGTRMIEGTDKYTFTLTSKENLSSTVTRYIFESLPAIRFQPGQFMEWSIPHEKPDSRGTRRWFTIASSPTENHIFLITKHAEQSSTYKHALAQLPIGGQISTHGVEGDFILPNEKTAPLVFIAGGIGITPFRSMVKYLLDTSEARDIILLYAVQKEEDLVCLDIFEEANKHFGLKIVPIISKPSASWNGYSGQINATIVQKEVPDIPSQNFYISGPEPMVEAIERMLVTIGAHRSKIHQDFFPGYSNDLFKE